MSGRVIERKEKWREEEPDDPHISGKARCIACAHEWVAVAPTGTTWLECPSCHTEKGLYRFPCEQDAAHWKCGCGNWYFAVTHEGYYCPNCGEWQTGF